MKRLYVLIDQKLDVVYGCVQGGHAVAQWLLEHPIRIGTTAILSTYMPTWINGELD